MTFKASPSPGPAAPDEARAVGSHGVRPARPFLPTGPCSGLGIALQNQFFELFEELLATRVEAAIAAGAYDVGLETLTAESLTVSNRAALYRHERTGAETSLLTIRREDKNEPASTSTGF